MKVAIKADADGNILAVVPSRRTPADGWVVVESLAPERLLEDGYAIEQGKLVRRSDGG